MNIIHNSKAYNVALKAAAGVITKNEDGKFITDKTQTKNWFTGKNKKGRQVITDIAIILEKEFKNAETGKFEMPTFTKVIVKDGYVELVTPSGSIDDKVILKPDEDENE